MSRGPFNSLTQAVLCATALALTSCGGGGGGGTGSGSQASSPPPPPPPPANVAPSATVTANDTAPQEGQYFTLDASATTDADTDPLTFSWVQTAGPTVDIPDATLDVLADLRVPELTATETATFELTVSDGTDSSVVSVDVAFTNIHQLPRFAGELPLAATVSLNGSIEGVFYNAFWGNPTFLGIATEKGGDINIFELSISVLDNLVTASLSSVIDSFKQPAKFQQTISASRVAADSQFFAIEETVDRLSVYVKKQSEAVFSMRGQMAIDSPCYILETTVPYKNVLFVGKRNNGFSLFVGPALDVADNVSFAIQQNVGTTESFCAINLARLPMMGSGGFADFDPRALEDALALDVETNTIHIFQQQDGATPDNAEYELREVVPVDLQTSKKLTFVKSLNLNNGLVMVFTDGVHNGTHRLVIVGLDEDRQIIQETHSWQTGVPTDMVWSNIDLDSTQNLIILSDTSPDAIVFEFGKANKFLPFTGPEYFETGLGGTLVFFAGTEIPDPVTFMMIADRDDREVRAYGPLP